MLALGKKNWRENAIFAGTLSLLLRDWADKSKQLKEELTS